LIIEGDEWDIRVPPAVQKCAVDVREQEGRGGQGKKETRRASVRETLLHTKIKR
jgi:hypothetical protein